MIEINIKGQKFFQFVTIKGRGNYSKFEFENFGSNNSKDFRFYLVTISITKISVNTHDEENCLFFDSSWEKISKIFSKLNHVRYFQFSNKL